MPHLAFQPPTNQHGPMQTASKSKPCRERERGLTWRTVNGSILGVLSRLEGSEFETRHTTASTATLELSPEATKNAYTLRHMKKASVVILAVFIGNSPAACAIVVLLCGNHVTFSLRSQSWKK